jgi:hypothetical protein
MYVANPENMPNIERLIVALSLAEKRLKDIDDQLDDPVRIISYL